MTVCRLAALTLALLSCGPTPVRAPTECVHRRLGGDRFGLAAPGLRGPSAVIAGQLRPVVAGVTSIPILEAREVLPDPSGIVVPVPIPEAARELPSTSYTVSVLRIGADPKSRRERWEELAGTSWIRLHEGWSLSRDDRGAGVLRIDPGVIEGRALVRVTAGHLPPRSLESEPFEVPADSSLELGYGVVDARLAVPETSTEFSVALACGDSDFEVVYRDRLDHAGARDGWSDARVALRPDPGVCRLRLVSSASGDDALAAVWAAPRVVGPTCDAQPPPRNLILISLDTLRADRLSGYGYSRATSPVIDRELIARGTRFADLSTTFPRTDVAHAGLFTGLYPAAFGDLPNHLPFTSPIRSMTEHLAEAGIETVAFTESALMSRRQGFWYGFDRFEEHAGKGRARETFALGMRYLEQVGDRPFFLFLHTYQVHSPYDPADTYADLFDAAELDGAQERIPAQHRQASTQYDREIRETDALLADLLDRIDALGLWGTTYVAVTSDHGEAFGEHGELSHGRSGYQEELRIPLVVRGPGVPAGRSIEAPTSIVDVAPTFLGLVGVSPLEHAQGRNLSQVVLGHAPAPEGPVFFEWIGGHGPRGVRDGRYKVLRANHGLRRLVVYDLESDPHEQRPIRGAHPARKRGRELLDRYEDEGAALAAALAPTRDEPPPAPIHRRVVEELRALGYVE